MKALLIDAGNTRIKWRIVDLTTARDDVLGEGNIVHAQLDELANSWSHPGFDVALVANVAGADILTTLEATVAQRSPSAPFTALRAQDRQCGVTNGYLRPERLGPDRWASLIGARALYPHARLIIASFGTATTIDLLEADGLFAGGVILPGFVLMRDALAQRTAGLPLAAGNYLALARDTEDAITSGIVHAQVGALERVAREIEGDPRGSTSAHICLICGGHARDVLPWLSFEATIVDNLVLRGLLEIAREIHMPWMRS